eukprot:NODE_7017_length_610_cov_1.178054_g6994_i0.p1 GENE.NODE_7017_length_610_cov_1.178054_g6994_i0~~NODE_7017_length_610_cov_1.178054_g6994_i0.p1  ORF type:complete len:114 (+),score=0.32 NODE_7017_length_610_cov_1.178054_g6994_i0:140-481(+)
MCAMVQSIDMLSDDLLLVGHNAGICCIRPVTALAEARVQHFAPMVAVVVLCFNAYKGGGVNRNADIPVRFPVRADFTAAFAGGGGGCKNLETFSPHRGLSLSRLAAVRAPVDR